MGYLLHVLRPQDLFIDIAANVGSYSVLAGRVIGTRAYAFEPVPTTFRKLVENMRLNHLEEKVRCLNVGVGANCGSIGVTSDLDSENHVVADDGVRENTINAPVTNLKGAALDVNSRNPRSW